MLQAAHLYTEITLFTCGPSHIVHHAVKVIFFFRLLLLVVLLRQKRAACLHSTLHLLCEKVVC